ncbi:disease resistance RPP13 4 [Olea europaea subsp. europaea]|uniref:Disease resistance RPP13 4 n=1 Tax=Olea europaea subsp. europaea TaxID=158383 RepID=A0A8S0RZA6_OLEEU|nr:disease resistance RPP13 4 [Olea europaea subsp. europaea]
MTSKRMKIPITEILSDCIDDTLKLHDNNNNDDDNDVASKLENIKTKDLNEAKEVFTQMKELEDVVMETFRSLENHIPKKETEVVSKKLNAIIKSKDEIKKFKSEYFPEIQEKTAVVQQEAFSSDENKKKMSEDWSSLQIEQNLFLSPTMSKFQKDYNILPTNLRICLLTFAIFPKKATIKKRILIHWWIGEGFVTKSSNMSAEEVGETIFDELIDKSWIQPRRKRKKSPTIYGCTMSPLIRRILISMARQSNFFDLDQIGNITKEYVQSGRLILDEGWSLYEYNTHGRLSTIFNVNEQYLSLREDFFSKIEKLKVLQLGRWQISPRYHIEVQNCKFFDKLKIQKKLIYLSLRGISQITTLPDSIRECVNLEILDLKACHNLERLFDIENLKKLTHINISECYCLSNRHEISRWTAYLQVLKGIPCTDFYKSFERLTQLRVLTLTCQNEIFSKEFHIIIPLEKLQLKNYREKNLRVSTFRSMFPLLKKLYIKGGLLENLSMDYSSPWEVEILRLNYLKKFRFEESCDMQKQFPNLLYLQKFNHHSSKDDIEWGIEDGWWTLKDKLKRLGGPQT